MIAGAEQLLAHPFIVQSAVQLSLSLASSLRLKEQVATPGAATVVSAPTVLAPVIRIVRALYAALRHIS